MTTNDLGSLFDKALKVAGKEKVEKSLLTLATIDNISSKNILTIVSNSGVHHLPETLKRGEIFIASKGSLDFSSQLRIEEEFSDVIAKVATKLKEREWKQIYLVPFGPANLSMLLKLLVYRVTHIETIDIIYVNGNYHEISVQLRNIIVNAK